MTDNVLDFEHYKHAQLLKRKAARVDEMRKAFRLARGESGPDKPTSRTRSRTKNKKK